MSMSDYLENKVLNATVGNVAYSTPTSVFMALYTVAPTESTAGTELVGNGYSRQLVQFSTAAANGLIQNTNTVNFSCSGNAWTLRGHAIVDTSTAGNIMYFSTQNRVVGTGETFTYAVDKISILIN